MLALAALLVAAGTIYTGITTFDSSHKQAKLFEEEGMLALDEAFRNASIIREDGRDFAASQSLQFIGAGVHLAGSALITMEQTIKYSEAEARATIKRGQAQASLAKKQADIRRSEGRAALIGSIIGVGSSLVSTKVPTKGATVSTGPRAAPRTVPTRNPSLGSV